MKVLITGAAGFLGSHFCDYLLTKGHKVTGVDNLITGTATNLKFAQKNKNFSFENMDICKSLPSDQFDWVINAASIASPVHYYRYPIETLRVGSKGLDNCLELARKCDARVLHLSTSEVYGDPEVHPQVETYWGNVNPIGPRSCYDESKRYGEALAKAFEKQFKMDIRMVRIFNTYGPRMAQNDGRLIPELTVQALRGQPLTIHGNGSQSRSFCYVDDLIAGMYALLEKSGLNGEVVNLGNPNEFTVTEFAQLLLKLTNSKSKIVYEAAWQDDPKRRRPDITKAKKLLNWEPKIGLEQGMKPTIAYFKTVV